MTVTRREHAALGVQGESLEHVNRFLYGAQFAVSGEFNRLQALNKASSSAAVGFYTRRASNHVEEPTMKKLYRDRVDDRCSGASRRSLAYDLVAPMTVTRILRKSRPGIALGLGLAAALAGCDSSRGVRVALFPSVVGRRSVRTRVNAAG
jgi:hypothetical protein